MTDKQTIIDGVDVSGCKGYYFSPTGYHSCQDILQINDLGYEQDTLCEQNPNCYFKQLARKEQECGKWKNAYEVKEDALEEAEEYIEELEEKYHKLQEQLKAENETYKKMLDNPEVHVALTDVRTGERDLWQKYKPRMEQAEQKLEKIKPILEYYANSYIGEKQIDGTYKYDLGDENCILYDPRKAEEWLKIINEVENE